MKLRISHRRSRSRACVPDACNLRRVTRGLTTKEVSSPLWRAGNLRDDAASCSVRASWKIHQSCRGDAARLSRPRRLFRKEIALEAITRLKNTTLRNFCLLILERLSWISLYCLLGKIGGWWYCADSFSFVTPVKRLSDARITINGNTFKEIVT